MVFFICILFILIVFMQIPSLIKNRYWRELTVFLAFLLPGFFISILLALGVQLPNPTEGIEFIVGKLL